MEHYDEAIHIQVVHRTINHVVKVEFDTDMEKMYTHIHHHLQPVHHIVVYPENQHVMMVHGVLAYEI